MINEGLKRDGKRMGEKATFQFPSGLEAAAFQSSLFHKESLADVQIPQRAELEFPTGTKCFNLTHEGATALIEELFRYFDPKLIHEFFVKDDLPLVSILAFSGSYVSKIVRCIFTALTDLWQLL
jgi:hypothetical protein